MQDNTPLDHTQKSVNHRAAHDLLRFINHAERLEALPRTGWLAAGIMHPESVAAHCYMVTFIATWLADTLSELEVNTELVMRIAMLHDISESLMTDIPGPVKGFIGKSHVANAETQIAQNILKDMPATWLSAFNHYQNLDCIEAKLVKAADRIQLFAKACQYQSQNRGDTSSFWTSDDAFDDFDIPLLKTIFDLLRQHHHERTWYANNFE